MIYIVGIGPGAKEYILPKAEEVMGNCDIVIGFERAINSIAHISGNRLMIKSLTETLNYINNNRNKDISIAASGDPCFYGITDYIKINYAGAFEIIPGISSYQYLMAKLNKSWQGAHLGSLHGRNEELLEKVKSSKLSIWLTDKNNSPNFICRELIKADIKAQVYVGENLSYEDERIVNGNALEVSVMDFNSLCVVVIETVE